MRIQVTATNTSAGQALDITTRTAGVILEVPTGEREPVQYKENGDWKTLQPGEGATVQGDASAAAVLVRRGTGTAVAAYITYTVVDAVPSIVVGTSVPDDDDGRPDGTIYKQTGAGEFIKQSGTYAPSGPVYATDPSGAVTGLVGPDGGRITFPIVVKNVGLQNPAAFSVTGTTDAQSVQLADLTGLLAVGDTVEIRATFGYTASTNAKTISFALGETDPGTIMSSSSRTSGSELSFEILYRFSVSSESGVTRQPALFVGTQATAMGAEQTIAWQNAKLFARLQLASAGETAGLFGYSVTILKAT